jgi:ABC-type uncharacterized transport system involved in gliding motility auxiliary subunit
MNQSKGNIRKIFWQSPWVFGILLGIGFIVLALSSWIPSVYRLDLTEDKLYTLSGGTVRLVEALENPIELKFYYSDELSRDLPHIRLYASQIQDLLKAYVDKSNGKIKLTVIKPEPFTDAEDQAVADGLQGVPVNSQGDQLFLGLAGHSNSSGKTEIIPFFHPDQAQMLEYQISQLVDSVSQSKLPVIGLISGLPISGGFDQMTQANQPSWIFLHQLKQSYEILDLGTEFLSIPDEVEQLLVIHPLSLDDKKRYAIDQFVLKGGKLILALDPLAESSAVQSFFPGMAQPVASDLPDLLAAWGVKYSAQEVVGDLQSAMLVGDEAGVPTRHLALLGLNPSNWNVNSTPLLKDLERINISTAGYFAPAQNATTKFEPVWVSSDQAMAISTDRLKTLKNISELMDDFKPSGKRYAMAALVTGPARSAFEAAPPAVAAGVQGGSVVSSENRAPIQGNHISQSKSIRVLVIADTDFLTDRLWVRIQEFWGQRVAQPWANNFDFLANGVDYLSGNVALMDIRARGQYSRPFDKVVALRQDAEAKFKKQQSSLQDKLEETERRLTELQGQQPLSAADGALNSQQEETLLSFQQEKLKIRKALRDVQFSLEKDIKSLGIQVKLLNTLAIPVVLMILALLISVRKRLKKKQARRVLMHS